MHTIQSRGKPMHIKKEKFKEKQCGKNNCMHLYYDKDGTIKELQKSGR